jgi:hypothetical protein
MSEPQENPHVALNNARNLSRSSPIVGRFCETPSAFHLTLTVSGESEQIVTDYCIAHLRERGYAVAPPNEKWETPSEFNTRLGICAVGITRALIRPGCPNVAIHYANGRGPHSKRIHSICSNAAFDAFVKSHKKPAISGSVASVPSGP